MSLQFLLYFEINSVRDHGGLASLWKLHHCWCFFCSITRDTWEFWGNKNINFIWIVDGLLGCLRVWFVLIFVVVVETEFLCVAWATLELALQPRLDSASQMLGLKKGLCHHSRGRQHFCLLVLSFYVLGCDFHYYVSRSQYYYFCLWLCHGPSF